MEYRIIGDIHGRTSWKNLIDVNAINVFVGDYFDPYDNIKIKDLLSNFDEIINFKKEYPNNFILLYGNHDLHYMNCPERYSRYDSRNAKKIGKCLYDAEEYFHGVAYAIGEDYIVTHAGISDAWADMYIPDVISKPSSMEAAINELWKNNRSAFMFEPNAQSYDIYGESKTQSPMWIRPNTLFYHNLYDNTGVKQIIGHTQEVDILEIDDIILVDCLGTVEKCYKIIID